MSVLEIVILLPILAAIAVWLGAPVRATSIAATLVNLVTVLTLCWQYAAKGATGPLFVHAREVLANPAISFSVGADGVSLLLALLTTLAIPAQFGIPALVIREVSRARADKAVWRFRDITRWAHGLTFLIGVPMLGISDRTLPLVWSSK